MSADRVELIQNVYRLLERGDLPALLELLDPNVVIEQTREIPWGGRYEGVEEARKFMGRVATMLEARVVVEQFVDSTDYVLAIGRTIGKVKVNGKHFDVPLAHIWHVPDHRIRGLQVYIENASMLRALS